MMSYLELSEARNAGAADGSFKIWDRRKTDVALYASSFHSRALLRVQWANYRPGRSCIQQSVRHSDIVHWAHCLQSHQI